MLRVRSWWGPFYYEHRRGWTYEIEPGPLDLAVSFTDGDMVRLCGFNGNEKECIEFSLADLLAEIGVIPGLIFGRHDARGKVRVHHTDESRAVLRKEVTEELVRLRS